MNKVILVILDGFGIKTKYFGNAISKAKTPTIDYLLANYLAGALKAAGVAVGLPFQEPGNSEVGHITISAGRIVYQILQEISFTIADGRFFKNPTLLENINHVKKNKSQLHFVGLVSNSSVHSYLEHLLALMELAKKENLDDFVIHFISDGKDDKPENGVEVCRSVMDKIKELRIGRIGTMIGRFYAMERDGYWERTETTYNLLTQGLGEKISDPIDYLKTSYQNNLTDEFIKPAILSYQDSRFKIQDSRIKDNDAVVFFNFRKDSMRQLAQSFVGDDFKFFGRKKLNNLFISTFTRYDDNLNTHIIFEPLRVKNSLAEVIEKNNLKQLRIGESFKYAHISYFFNCGQETAYKNEERIIVPSLDEITIEDNPQLMAPWLTQNLIKAMKEKRHDFIVVNFANADVLGHTGNFEAIVKAIESLDNQLSYILEELDDWTLIITADHGNAEEKIDIFNGEVRTGHSLNNVPFWLVDQTFKKNIPQKIKLDDLKVIGLLSDVAPTILDILRIEKPSEMTGESLLKQLIIDN
ncbi:2,3-bisphosphoglycerate-independent phosphoglycerate mutase [Candidatus Azambacteria bacterium]|nr:2,3-bisphosphoglycerate-independent phosphoglycerate mutase [Candidatus Azambacteria bacterium]